MVPDPKWICPDRPRRKMDMSRLSCVQKFSCALRAFEGKYVQTIPDRNGICPDFRVFFSRPSCAPNQIRAFNAKIFVRPCPDFRAFMSRTSCGHQTIVRSCPDHRAFMSRPSCVHPCLILNARHSLRAFISVWTYPVSVWDLSLGWARIECFSH